MCRIRMWRLLVAIVAGRHDDSRGRFLAATPLTAMGHNARDARLVMDRVPLLTLASPVTPREADTRSDSQRRSGLSCSCCCTHATLANSTQHL